MIEHFKLLKKNKFFTEAFLSLYFQIESLSKENIKNDRNLKEYLLSIKKIEKSFAKKRTKFEKNKEIQAFLSPKSFQKEIFKITKSNFLKLSLPEKNFNILDIKKMFKNHDIQCPDSKLENVSSGNSKSAKTLRNTLVHDGKSVSESELEKFEKDMIEIYNHLLNIKNLIEKKWD